MKSTKMLTILVVALGLMVCFAEVSEAAPMGTAWTYQGRLMDANGPADGQYDFEFRLYADPVLNSFQIGGTVDINDLDVIDGYFTVELDFGDKAFTGDARWLQIGVRPGDSEERVTILSPRHEVTPTPYAIYAENTGNDNDWMVSNSNMYSIPTGYIGIGTNAPVSKLEVMSTENHHGIRSTVPYIAVYGHRTGTTGTWPGVHGECDSNSNSTAGVRGVITSTTPGINSAGVRGTNNGTGDQGAGVYGWHAGDGYGVYGDTAGNGIGVYGIHSSSTGQEPGIKGVTNTTSSYCSAIVGEATSTTGAIYGVQGLSASNSGTGVVGRATAASGNTEGVFGQSDSIGGTGVMGWASNGEGTNYGGYFQVAGADGTGVFAFHDSGIGTAPAVMARNDSASANAFAVHGRLNNISPGSMSAGIFGENLGTGSAGIGVYGSQNGTGWGVYGRCIAGTGVRAWGGQYGVFSVGDIFTTGYYLSSSDARFKENIQPLTDSLSTILKLRGVQFNWKQDEYPEHNFSEDRQVGFIAQEVAQVLPEVVNKSDDEDGFYSVSYGRIVPVLVEAIKELKAENESLKNHLSSENQSLKQRLEALERTIHQLTEEKELKL
ncbi:MAG TPA: tail fiber domain-containing protein [Sedimentisphaerales bacterium]|nr:tail fiber domain-containing protein [Sedimentisphaerales bacterium]